MPLYLNSAPIFSGIEGVKLESQTSLSECRNVKACFPVKVPESDWEEVNDSSSLAELETENGGNEDLTESKETEETNETHITEPEELLSRLLPVTYEPPENVTNKYRTRSKGPVDNENWIMKKAM